MQLRLRNHVTWVVFLLIVRGVYSVQGCKSQPSVNVPSALLASSELGCFGGDGLLPLQPNALGLIQKLARFRVTADQARPEPDLDSMVSDELARTAAEHVAIDPTASAWRGRTVEADGSLASSAVAPWQGLGWPSSALGSAYRRQGTSPLESAVPKGDSLLGGPDQIQGASQEIEMDQEPVATKEQGVEAVEEKEAAAEWAAAQASSAAAEAEARAVAEVRKAREAADTMERAWSAVQATSERGAHEAVMYAQSARLMRASLLRAVRSQNETGDSSTTAEPAAEAEESTGPCKGHGGHGGGKCKGVVRVLTWNNKTHVLQGFLNWTALILAWLISLYVCCCVRERASIGFLCACQFSCLLVIGLVAYAIMYGPPSS